MPMKTKPTPSMKQCTCSCHTNNSGAFSKAFMEKHCTTCTPPVVSGAMLRTDKKCPNVEECQEAVHECRKGEYYHVEFFPKPPVQSSPVKEELCKHCGGEIRITNPKGFCSHVYYPDNCEVCSAKEEPASDWEKRFDEIGFGNQARIVGTKRVELKDFIKAELGK